jgi:hypothetical protein
VKAARKDDLAQLRGVLGELAAADAAEVVAEARASARVKARALIEEALVEEIVRAAATQQEPPVPAAAGPETRARSTDGHVMWLYGVVRAADADVLPPDLAGVEPGARVEILREGDLAALVSPVPRDEYADELLREHLNDIEWVERTARAHEHVLETALLSGMAVVPFRLCTLYREPERVCDLLRDEGHEVRRSLAAVEGRAEWGMKVFVDRERLAEALAAEEALGGEGSHDGEGEGTEYLARKQQSRALRADWDDAGFQFELTGPWPAYNFVSTSMPATP